MKRMKSKIVRRILEIIIAMALFFAIPMQVNAAEGKVIYGSNSYTWYTNQVAPLGVYIESDAVIASYEIELSFDTTKLRYIDGATEQVDNKLYIRSGGDQKRYKHMLHFEVLGEGGTSVTVVSAKATTAATETTLAENVQMVELSVAPIQILEPFSNKLSALSINGQSLEGFQPDVFEYHEVVSCDVNELDIDAVAEADNAVVSVSETKLNLGKNEIDISVRGSNGEQVYKLDVTRMAPFPVADITEFVGIDNGENEPQNEPVADDTQNEPESGNNDEQPVMEENVNAGEEPKISFWQKPLVKSILSNIILWIGVLAIFILLIYYIIRTLRIQKMQLRYEKLSQKQNENADIIDLNKVVVTIAHVTMKFKMAQDEASSIKEYFIRTLKRQHQYRYLTALNDISFKVRQGDVVGIIGTNGSGKSTLLKIISGALIPTKGKVKVDKSKVQILTLGTGFDMELTGKENVYLNGAIIGYSKEYIDEKYDEIVEFAELEGFMDQKMKNFSSGMVSRLGFAIATMRDTPEILILDEVLSVGDMFFKQKSEKRIREMIHSGATVFMVAHGMDTILKNCNKVVWIEKGVMKMAGNPQKVCEAYKNYNNEAT